MRGKKRRNKARKIIKTKEEKKALKSHRPCLCLYDPAPCVSISVGDPLCSDPLDSGVERKTWQLGLPSCFGKAMP